MGIFLGLAFVSAQLRDVLSVSNSEKDVVFSYLRETFNIILILLFWSSVLLAVIPSSFITTKVTQNPLNGLVTVKCSIYILFIPLVVISLVETINLLLKPNETAYDDLIDAWGIFSVFFLVFISFIYYKLSIKINQYASHHAITQVKLR